MRTYHDYYKSAREIYGRQRPDIQMQRDVYGLTIAEVHSEKPNAFVQPPAEYRALVASLAERIAARLDANHAVLAEPKDAGSGFAQKLSAIWDLPELEALGASVVPQLEETLFGSFAYISAVHIYRSLVTAEPPKASWLWHYDNNPLEVIKFLIYLTDCDSESGAFEYICEPGTGKGVKIASSRTGFDHWTKPLFEGSRVPEPVIQDYLQQGYEIRRVVGPAGTGILFDNNCIHRATVPKWRHRDAMVLLLRPVDRPIRPFISRTYTGSWIHKEPVVDPDLLTPVPKEAGFAAGQARSAVVARQPGVHARAHGNE